VGENVVMRLIGLVTTVLVLGAAYLFIVKPVLDTTNNAFDSVNGTIDNAFEESGLGELNLDDIQNGDFGDIQNTIEDSGLDSAQQKRAEKLLACVQRVQPDTTKMQKCAERFQ
jgi:hypothetical protein